MRFIAGCLIYFIGQIAFAQSLPSAIDTMINRHHINKSDISIVVQEVNNARPLLTLNANISRSPASITKLFTTATGLILLGPDYKWHTRFYVDELPDSQGIIRGNIYIKGGGDPFLVQEYLQSMIEDLKAKGIKQIKGDIVLDRSMYFLTDAQRDRESFDGKKWSAYNAVPDPLMVNFRTVTFTVTPQKGKNVSLSVYPHFLNWHLNNRLTVNHGSCAKNNSIDVNITRDDKGYANIDIKGRYSTKCGVRDVTVVMGDPSEQFYYLFNDLIKQSGINFQGAGRMGKTPKSAQLFYQGETKPLSEQIQIMNRLSNNVMTRQLFLTLGVDSFGEPGSLEKSRQSVKQTLTAFGVNMQPVFIDNGSGLSRTTHITASVLADLLQKMMQSSYADVFEDSLSVAGHNGTLKRRYRGEALDHKVYGKTGTMNQTRAFAGYVHARSGKVYVVVIIGNGKSAVKSRRLQDDILKWVYKQ